MLNIINEAEINYKAARNKRLHVELVIIKLCYLQQAIELTSDGGGISKKKIVESSLAFRTAAIKPLKVESHKTTDHSPQSTEKHSEAKLVIETSFVKEDSENYKPAELQTSIPIAIGIKLQTIRLALVLMEQEKQKSMMISIGIGQISL